MSRADTLFKFTANSKPSIKVLVLGNAELETELSHLLPGLPTPIQTRATIETPHLILSFDRLCLKPEFFDAHAPIICKNYDAILNLGEAEATTSTLSLNTMIERLTQEHEFNKDHIITLEHYCRQEAINAVVASDMPFAEKQAIIDSTIREAQALFQQQFELIAQKKALAQSEPAATKSSLTCS